MSIAKLIQKEISDKFKTEVQNYEKEDIINIKKSADIMLKRIAKAANKTKTEMGKTRNKYNYYFQDVGKELREFIKSVEDRKEGALLREQTQLAIFQFEEDLNKFLNRDIRLTLVDENGQIYITSKNYARAVYANVTSDFDIAKKSFNQANNRTSLVMNDIKNINIEKYHSIYQTAIARYNETLANYSIGKNIYSSFIYWHEQNNKRIYGFVQSKGSLSEAYVASVYYQDNYDNNMEIALSQFYKERVLNVDSASEILHGDVGEDEYLQLAVKGLNASFGGYSQWIKLAIKIRDSQDILNKETLEVMVSEVANTPALINNLTEKVEQTMQNVLPGELYKVSINIG